MADWINQPFLYGGAVNETLNCLIHNASLKLIVEKLDDKEKAIFCYQYFATDHVYSQLGCRVRLRDSGRACRLTVRGGNIVFFDQTSSIIIILYSMLLGYDYNMFDKAVDFSWHIFTKPDMPFKFDSLPELEGRLFKKIFEMLGCSVELQLK